MGELNLPRIPFKSLPNPLLRLMPTLFAYTRLSAVPDADPGPQVREIFVAHLRVLEKMVNAAVADAGLDAADSGPSPLRYRSLDTLTGASLARELGDLVGELQELYGNHRRRLKPAVDGAPDFYRALYRSRIEPTNILAVFAEDTWSGADSLRDRLVERCWYDARCRCETDGVVWPAGMDVVLLAPGARPIRTSVYEAVIRADVPVVVLSGRNRKKNADAMAVQRVAFLYRQEGHPVLHGPVPPARLFQAVDPVRLQHLASRHETGCSVMTAMS